MEASREKKKVKMGKAVANEIAMIAVWVVQARGEVSFDTIEQDFRDHVGVTVNRKTLSGVLEALRKREIFAERYRSGERVYSMKKTLFNCKTEIATLEDIKLRVGEDPAMALLNEWFGAQKKEGKSIYPAAWVRYEATLKLRSPWLGQHPLDGSPVHMLNYEHSSIRGRRANEDPAISFLTFERSNGSIVINRACQKGFLASQMRLLGHGPRSVDNFGITDWHIDVEGGAIQVMRLPIQRHSNNPNEGTGAGMADYEALPIGTVLKWTFTAPMKNFLTPDEMRSFLAWCLLLPHDRSMSPARGSQYGSAELLDLQVLESFPCIGRNRGSEKLEIPLSEPAETD